MPIATADGCDIYYEVAGSGPALVFIHGGFGGLGTGRSVAPPRWHDRFAGHFTLVTYDRRSAGRSGFPETPHTMSLFADDLKAVLDAAGIPRAAIWGTSAGAPIAITFALRYPDATSALVVTDAAPWFSRDETTISRLKERIALLESEGVEAAYEARRTGGTVGLQLFAAERPAASPEEEAARVKNRERIQAEMAAIPREERIAKYGAELRTYSAYADFDVSNSFRSLAMPTLVIWGTGETLFPNAGWDKLTATMPNVEYLPVAGADHGVTETHPETLDAIESFLLRVAAS